MSYVIRLARSEDLQAIQQLGGGIGAESLADMSGDYLHLVACCLDTKTLVAYAGFRPGGGQPGTHKIHIYVHTGWYDQGLEQDLLDQLLSHFHVDKSVLGARIQSDDLVLKDLLVANGFVEVERMLHIDLILDESDLSVFDSLLKRISDQGIDIVSLADEMESRQDALQTWHTFEQRTGSDDSFENFCSWFKRRQVIPEACFFAKKDTAYVGNSFLSLLNVKSEPNVMEQGYTKVDERYRNQGIATALKVYTTSFAKEKGYHLLKNKHKKIERAYESCEREIRV